jgi:hypothetical protein
MLVFVVYRVVLGVTLLLLLLLLLLLSRGVLAP